ncbi:twin-arginine translocase TatA/TatE family subunit [Gilliamella sp. ESL0405]|nr:twin-arginine translocase TatA/TatE family subunit [Gilliamella sp. ESL0405]
MMLSMPKLLIIIAVIVLLFGTKKLRSLGSDLGASIKGFKKAMNDDDEQDSKKEASDSSAKVEDLTSTDDDNNKKE